MGDREPRGLTVELETAEDTGLLSEGRELSYHGSNFHAGGSDDAMAARKLDQQIGHQLEEEELLVERMAAAEELLDRVKCEMKEARKVRQNLEGKRRALANKSHLMPPRPGPFDWVDSYWFGAVSCCVVGLNFATMVASESDKLPNALMHVFNSLFLIWYLFELLVKFLHHGLLLFFGPWKAAWWNWLDLGIVISGVVDEWLLPSLTGKSGSNFSFLRMLRLFRFFRMLKLVKAFLVADLEWVSGNEHFDVFMACVIVFNGLVISWQLDYEWDGWGLVDTAFLIIYVFDLMLRIKRWGIHFFVHHSDWAWNWLDFLIVLTGIMDLWLLPGIVLLRRIVFDEDTVGNGVIPDNVLSLVKLMRLMRVLRLVRVLRSVPPLYTLLMGVFGAFQAMKWVIVLTLLMLYAGAIIFTNLVGKGLIYDNQEPPPAAVEAFGSMRASIFSLFELMNGDTEVIKPIQTKLAGKFLFAGFMVIANWAVLAILTAVVSENMISTSSRFAEEDRKKKSEEAQKKSEARLLEIFERGDPSKSGKVSKKKWLEMLNDGATRLELAEGTHLTKEDMVDLFECLAIDDTDDDDNYVDYPDLIHSLKANSTVADKRSVLHVMIRLRAMQGQLTEQRTMQYQHVNARFDELKKLLTAQADYRRLG